MQPLSSVGMKLVTEQEIEDLKKQASNYWLIYFEIKCFADTHDVTSVLVSLFLHLQHLQF